MSKGPGYIGIVVTLTSCRFCQGTQGNGGNGHNSGANGGNIIILKGSRERCNYIFSLLQHADFLVALNTEAKIRTLVNLEEIGERLQLSRKQGKDYVVFEESGQRYHQTCTFCNMQTFL